MTPGWAGAGICETINLSSARFSVITADSGNMYLERIYYTHSLSVPYSLSPRMNLILSNYERHTFLA